jgi:hypothetical protein
MNAIPADENAVDLDIGLQAVDLTTVTSSMEQRQERFVYRIRGAVRRHPWGVGATAPFGRLELDDVELTIAGFGLVERARRPDVRAIRLTTGLMTRHVKIIWADGTKAPTYFATSNGNEVRAALLAKGWPVEEPSPPNA